jgi:hypothetical protein
MKNRKIDFRLLASLILFVSCCTFIKAQEIKWLRVSDLAVPVNDIGAIVEGEFTQGSTDYFSWPAIYGIHMECKRADALWIGCKNFDDPVENKIKSYKVIGAGPRPAPDRTNQIFEKEIKLYGKNPHPIVVVDDQNATENNIYDLLDDTDPNLIGDRMVLVKFNTSMGISVTQKTFQFVNSLHGNYVIRDYVFKNTGIYNRNGDVKEQTLQDVWFYWLYRWAFSGEANDGFNLGWAAWSDTWGNSTINHSFGEDVTAPEFTDPSSPIYQMRGYYSWRGPNKERPVSYAEDWGLPNETKDGVMAAAKYAGIITLHADKNPKDTEDDILQPKNTWYISSDISITNANSQYDEVFMADRFAAMSEGHPPAGQHNDDVVDDDYPINYTDPRRQTGGGVSQEQGFGPYTLAPGDSIHIVFAEAVAGLSREKNREVGANWLQYYNQNPNLPTLVLPNGSTTNDYNDYKRKWVETCKDSIIKTLRLIKLNYESGYTLPGAPPPPGNFTVTSGGDRIRLTWSNESESDPKFNGYVIYRSQGNVKDGTTKYIKIFECTRSNAVNSFDDVTAQRGNDYYYYIQAKDDGSQNPVNPGQPIYSSALWTVTSVEATLQRPAEPENPIAPDADTTYWKSLAQSTGLWIYGDDYSQGQVVTYNNSDYYCFASITSDTIPPDQNSTYWKLITIKGGWISGSGYKAYDAVTYNGANYITLYAISAGKGLELVRIVPNPYDIRSRLFQFGENSQYDRIAFYGLPPVCKLKIFTERGDLIWEKDHTRGTGDELWDSKTSSGQIIASGIYILYVETPEGKSVFRKFVVIR